MRTRPFALAVIALTIACHDVRQPTEPPTVPSGPSEIISDGAHCNVTGIVCNPDFFWLPPMVPLPLNNSNFELGQFNNTLASRIRIDICELKSENLNAQGLPTASTGCGPIVKQFATGSVKLVNLPLRQNGWWTLFNLPPDGFYYVLWDTRQSNLAVTKYYRIKVFIDGATDPLGVADVDPMSNIFQWKFTLTNQVIQLVDDVMLPIPFRIEHGGGSSVCGTSSLCISKTITNNDPSGSQSVTLEGGAGSIAGATFPNGWLPTGGPQSVVVTIAQVNVAGGGSTSDPNPCHVGLALPQYKGCFRFTTTPALARDEGGAEFAQPVRVAVCYELAGTGGLEKFAELWSSGPNEPPHRLEETTDAGLLGAASRNCNTTPPVIGSADANPLVRFASAGWSRIKSGLGHVFGLKTAYAVDLGLGGFTAAFSNISAVRTQELVATTATNLTVVPGATITDTVRVIGSNHHSNRVVDIGIGGVPVTFTLAAGNGSLLAIGGEGAGSNQVQVLTNTYPIDESAIRGGGFAAVNWTVPVAAGAYTLTVTSPALGSPVTFHVTVSGALDLGSFDGTVYSWASGINDAGHVVGTNLGSSGYTPFIWINGVMTPLARSDGASAWGNAINSNDMVVGQTEIAPATYRAAYWVNGEMTILGTLPGTNSSIAQGVNASGQILGFSYTVGSTNATHAWIWQNGVMTDLGFPPGGTFAYPYAINDAGQAIGWSDAAGTTGWIWEDGEMANVAGNGAPSQLFGINNNGDVTGIGSVQPNVRRAFSIVGGTVTTFDPLPGDDGTTGYAISNDGTVVGISGADGQQRVVAWRNGHAIPFASLGGSISVPHAVNSSGQIVGESDRADGIRHATLWTIPPAP